jgi:hypothetical protein
MTDQTQRSDCYESLCVTVKCDGNERSVIEDRSHVRTHRSKDTYRQRTLPVRTIFYDANQHRSSASIRSTTMNSNNQKRSSKSYERTSGTLPLPTNNHNHQLIHFHGNGKTLARSSGQQRGQYRNRKAELDWDHTFDLDQLDLYTITNDIDNHSVNSLTSSSDQSL